MTFVALVAVSCKWVLKVSRSSSVSPKYFTVGVLMISMLFSLSFLVRGSLLWVKVVSVVFVSFSLSFQVKKYVFSKSACLCRLIMVRFFLLEEVIIAVSSANSDMSVSGCLGMSLM